MAEQVVYCTVDDVQRWIKRVQFSESSKVTISDVNFYIQVVSAVMDGELRRLGITLPISYEAKITQSILRSMASLEAASLAEQAANFGSNKNESTHGKGLHDQYLALLDQIKSNPCMLSDTVMASVSHMKSSTEDMLEGGDKEGDEIFTKQHIDDFRDDYKVPSPSEQTSSSESITGEVPRTRI